MILCVSRELDKLFRVSTISRGSCKQTLASLWVFAKCGGSSASVSHSHCAGGRTKAALNDQYQGKQSSVERRFVSPEFVVGGASGAPEEREGSLPKFVCNQWLWGWCVCRPWCCGSRISYRLELFFLLLCLIARGSV